MPCCPWLHQRTTSLLSLAILLAIAGGAGPLAAQADSIRPVTGQNPTQVVSQFQPYIIIQSLSNGVTGYSVVPAGTLALAPRLQVQAQLPYVFRTAGDDGVTSVSGFGDPQWELILAAPVRGSTCACTYTPASVLCKIGVSQRSRPSGTPSLSRSGGVILRVAAIVPTGSSVSSFISVVPPHARRRAKQALVKVLMMVFMAHSPPRELELAIGHP